MINKMSSLCPLWLKVKISNIYLYFKSNRFLTKKIKKINLSGRRCVLFVIHDMTKTGAPVLALNIAKEMYKDGYAVVVISKSPGVLAEEFSKVAKLILCKSPGLVSEELEELIVSNFKSVFINSIVTTDWLSWFKSRSIKTITLVHELPQVVEVFGVKEYAKNALEESDVVIYPSNFVKSSLERYLNTQTQNGKILTQGIYNKKVGLLSRKDAKEIVQREFNIDNRPLVINVANGNYRKGFDLFYKMVRLEPNLNFMWVGDIDSSFDDLCNEKPVLDNLHMPGYVSDTSILLNIYMAAELLVLTSREEPFGSIVLEAMHVGTPVVAFKDVGGFEDVVIHNETGFLVDCFNVDEMIKIINVYVSDQELKNRISCNAEDSVRGFNFNSYIHELLTEADL